MRELYDKLVEAGEYTQSFEQFKKQWGSDEESYQELHDGLVEAGDYTGDFERFKFDYEYEPVKIEAVVEVADATAENTASTDSTLESGSLESQPRGEFYIEGDKLEYADPKEFVPSNFNLPKPIIESDDYESVNENGQNIKGDTRPKQIQIDLYKKRYDDILTASGEYEFLKDKPLSVRKQVLEKENIPSYGEVVEIKEDLGFVEKATEFAYKLGTAAGINTGNSTRFKPETRTAYKADPLIVDRINEATKDIDVEELKSKEELEKLVSMATNKVFTEDPLIKKQVETINLEFSDDFEKIRKDLQSKYDMTDPDQFTKASEEFNTLANKMIFDELSKTKIYKETSKSIQIGIGEKLFEKNKEFRRDNNWFLNLIDETRKFTGIKDDPEYVSGIWGDTVLGVIEGAGKSVLNIEVAARQLALSSKEGSLDEKQMALSKLKIEIDKLQSTKRNRMKSGIWEPRTNSNTIGDGDNKRYFVAEKEVSKRGYIEYNQLSDELEEKMKLLQPLTNEIEKGFKNIEGSIDTIESRKELIGSFYSVETEGLFADSSRDLFTLLSEQAVNIGLATAGQVTGNPLVTSLALASMFTQEYGESYYGAVVIGLSEELNRKPTNAEIAKALEDGKYASVGVAAAGALVSTGFEYLGFKAGYGAAVAKGKIIGAVPKLIRNREFGKIALKAAQTTAVAFEAGSVEYGTEFVQEVTKQVAQGVQVDVLGNNGNNPLQRVNLLEANEAGVAGFNVGLLMAGGGQVTQQAKVEYNNIATELAINFDLGSFGAKYRAANDLFMEIDNGLDMNFKNRTTNSNGVESYTKEQYKEDKQSLADMRNAGIKLPTNYSKSSKKSTFEALVELERVNREIERNKEASTEGLSIPLKERAEELQLLIGRIRVTENFTQKAMQAAKGSKIAEGIDIYETRQEAQDAVDLWNSENPDSDPMTLGEGKDISDGAISGDGSRVIIDLETAKTMGNVNVAAHEILHKVLVKTFAPIDTGKKDKNGKPIYTQSKAALQVEKALRNELNKIDGSILKPGSELSKKLEAYKDNNESVQAEELLTLLGDLLKVEGIEIKETVAVKLGNILRRVLQDLGFKNIKFKTGKDVINFIKDFNYETKRGKFSKATEKATKQGIEIDKDISNTTVESQMLSESNSKNSKINNDKNYKIVINESLDFGDRFVAADALIQENKGIIYPKLGIDVSGDLSTAAIDRAMINQILGESVWQDKEGKTRRRPKGIFESYIPSGKKGGSEVITYLPATLAKRRDEIFREAGFTPESNIFTKLDNPDVKQMADTSTTTPKIKGIGKARVSAAFEEFTAVTPGFMKEVLNIVTPILNTTSNPDIQAENIIEALDEVAAKEITNLLYNKLGKISTQKDPVSGRIEYIMPKAYTQFFDTQSDLFSRAIPLEDIKKVYTRSTPKLFKVTKVGRENIKNVNKFTGKVTYPGRDIFKIEAAGKGAIGSFFLANNRNSVTRQNTLFKIMGKGLASPSVYNYLSEPRNVKNITGDPKTQVAIALENEKLLVTAVGLDRKAFEDRSFDNFKNSKVVNSLNIKRRGIFQAGFSDFISGIQGLVGANGRDFGAAKIAMFDTYGPQKDSGFTPKEYEGIIKDFDNLINRYIEGQAKYTISQGKPSTVTVAEYVTGEFVGQTVREDLRKITNLKKDSLNFNNADQLQSYSNSIVLLGQHLVNVLGQERALDFMVNMVGPSLTGMGKTGSGKYMFNESGSIVENPNPRGSMSLRYGLYNSQETFMNVVLKPMVSNKGDLKMTTVKTGKNKGEKGKSILYKNKALTKTKVTQSADAMKAILLKKDYQLTQREKESKQDALAFIEVLDFYKNQVADSNSKINMNDAGMMLMGMNSDMRTILRTAAGLESITEGKFPTLDYKQWRWEHSIPARVVVLFAGDYINGGSTTKADMEQLMKDYHVSMIPKAMDDVVGLFNKDTMIVGWKIGDNVYTRYYNFNTFGSFAYSMKDIRTGKLIPISKNQPAAYKAVEKAKVFNENKFKNSKITFPKNATNKTVLDEMESLDIKAQNARSNSKNSKVLNEQFNFIIEQATGIARQKQYGKTKARAVGATKGRFDLFGIPPSAQDFVGLTRYFAGKGKKGDATIAWIKENFLDPFARANIDISNARVALTNDFKNLKKILNITPKDLNKLIPGEPYTVAGAVRVYTWTQQGMSIPGLSKADQKILVDFVENDPNLVSFANQLISINKENGYPKPSEGWLGGTIKTDLLASINNISRPKYLKQWQENVDQVFSEENLNKLEAAYGKGYRDALENILGRMKSGSNRGFKGDTLTGRFIDWINASVGSIMFFNSKSSVLQTISSINFINFGDNNIFKAAKAFANQSQYWKDVMKLMNSDYLIERRNGLKINVSEADIAEIAAESKNKAKAFIAKILKLGFLPTQIADSLAISLGGATFYRNRVDSLLKEGMTLKEAESQAFLDFREISEESQQSSRPDRISAQQAGPLGRIILAFANTPAQYARLMQKAASDLKNRRGDDKTNISKIIYYGVVQNIIFNALQQALFAVGFGDEADEEQLDQKKISILNGMLDSLLRGVGFHGAAISTLKNAIMKLASGGKAQDAAIELLDISPPVSSKIGKLRAAGRTWDWNQKEMRQKGWSLDNPAWLAAGQVVSSTTNIPLDRAIKKLRNIKDASDAENEEWQRVANALGWSEWELEWKESKNSSKTFGRLSKISLGGRLKTLKL